MTSFDRIAGVVLFASADETSNGVRTNAVVSAWRVIAFVNVYREQIDTYINTGFFRHGVREKR